MFALPFALHVCVSDVRNLSGNPAGDTETSSMMIAHSAVNYVGLETMLHMTCVNTEKEKVKQYLKKAKVSE